MHQNKLYAIPLQQQSLQKKQKKNQYINWDWRFWKERSSRRSPILSQYERYQYFKMFLSRTDSRRTVLIFPGVKWSLLWCWPFVVAVTAGRADSGAKKQFSYFIIASMFEGETSFFILLYYSCNNSDCMPVKQTVQRFNSKSKVVFKTNAMKYFMDWDWIFRSSCRYSRFVSFYSAVLWFFFGNLFGIWIEDKKAEWKSGSTHNNCCVLICF